MEFCVTKPRSFIRHIIRNCVVCKPLHQKHYSHSENPKLSKISPTAPAFINTGCNYADLLQIKNV